jgi:hypothetical protein
VISIDFTKDNADIVSEFRRTYHVRLTKRPREEARHSDREILYVLVKPKPEELTNFKFFLLWIFKEYPL